MRNSNDHPMVLVPAIDDLIGKAAHQVIVVVIVALWKPLRIRADRLHGLIEFHVKPFGSRNAPRTSTRRQRSQPQQQSRRQGQSSSPALRRARCRTSDHGAAVI